jgi:hypothetical protein
VVEVAGKAGDLVVPGLWDLRVEIPL